MGKESTCNVGDAGDAGLILGLESYPGGGHGNPLQHSCLEIPVDRGSWWAAVHRAATNWTPLKWLSTHMHPFRGTVINTKAWISPPGILMKLASECVTWDSNVRSQQRTAASQYSQGIRSWTPPFSSPVDTQAPHSIAVVQSLSHIWLFAAPWTAACHAFLSFIISISSTRILLGTLNHSSITYNTWKSESVSLSVVSNSFGPHRL